MPSITPDPVKQAVQEHWHGRAAPFDAAPNHGVHSRAQHDAWQIVLAGLAPGTGLLTEACGMQ